MHVVVALLDADADLARHVDELLHAPRQLGALAARPGERAEQCRGGEELRGAGEVEVGHELRRLVDHPLA
eukprot:scaffold128560_cov63-Phaeocystis_antarctica.AAC.1